MRSRKSGWYLIYRRINARPNPWKLLSTTAIFTCKTKIIQRNSAVSSKVICKQCEVMSTHVYFLVDNRDFFSVVTLARMDTQEQGWTSYDFYTTEIVLQAIKEV